ncbi:hypothetical protein AMAG_12310 [Allomyces macrogynus ATCC 38327]|uniref:Uncharacterized protein n=1 Tax=Allomyces macrogynus (strain ATCC 38327) TaxID=578462 RepID=A0A0L0SXF2_ALLM3|nr:hypothetical protein AMAG_12310 [Allomyces macrogynus ATCC 38327]|eukprot:KNE67238.1 hypothetical protein AMAG_12310 [Allomyces macrogynus ATCC 38327]
MYEQQARGPMMYADGGAQGQFMDQAGPQYVDDGPYDPQYDDVSPYPDSGPQTQYMDGPQPQYMDGPQQPQYIDGPNRDMGHPQTAYPTLGDVHDDGIDFADPNVPDPQQRPLINVGGPGAVADSRVVYAGGPDAARAVPMPVLPPLPPHVTPPPPTAEYGQPAAPNPMLHPELYANSIDHEEQARQMEGRPSREGPKAEFSG